MMDWVAVVPIQRFKHWWQPSHHKGGHQVREHGVKVPFLAQRGPNIGRVCEVDVTGLLRATAAICS